MCFRCRINATFQPTLVPTLFILTVVMALAAIPDCRRENTQAYSDKHGESPHASGTEHPHALQLNTVHDDSLQQMSARKDSYASQSELDAVLQRDQNKFRAF
jgi:hypothetical protein